MGNSNPYSNSERGFLVMRGGGTLANGYYLDGFPMSYPYHLGDQSSVLNNNIIKSFNVYSGAFPVQFGFATGGIIDIKTPDTVAKTSSVLNLNTFLSDVYHQNKISENLYAIVSARKSYPNLTLLKLYPDGIPQDAKYADYEDYQAKFNWKPGTNHTFNVLLFGARDKQKYTKAQDDFENSKNEFLVCKERLRVVLLWVWIDCLERAALDTLTIINLGWKLPFPFRIITLRNFLK